ncbi:NAD-dependent epimerase/dehydratase family protein [Pseudomonas costantinii]|uniref:NAD(P)H-binding protein n=1 Tax=Pseudomonas costantinii TaxID=168469 RepID=UPI0015A18532|nr:NAD(P)H-binding protein [Pseudomonas costantinii]NVZ18725.1 NAD-dependent epimerase/dehydratase family protein [Pseudomonas costantinii]
MKRTAWIAGANGQVGSECVALLCNDARYERVLGLVRRPTAFAHPTYQEKVIDFDNLPAAAEWGPCDDLYIALGQSSQDKALFFKVDCQYPVELALFAQRHGAKRVGYVSTLGASLHAQNDYFQVKAQAETELCTLGFESCCFVRPSMTYGNKDHRRPLQRLSRYIDHGVGWAFLGPLKKYRPVSAVSVAASLIDALNSPVLGNRPIESNEINRCVA